LINDHHTHYSNSKLYTPLYWSGLTAYTSDNLQKFIRTLVFRFNESHTAARDDIAMGLVTLIMVCSQLGS